VAERRTAVVERLAHLVGADALTLTDLQQGWPSLATLKIDDSDVPIALFVGPVTSSQRGRDHRERRFQNPGQGRSIEHVPGRTSVLVGLWDTDHFKSVHRPLLVMADAYVRTGLRTRYSVFVSLGGLIEASASGWSSIPNERGELIRCFVPSLLPVAVRAAGIQVVETDDAQLRSVILGSGLIDEAEEEGPAAARARRAAQVIMRDRAFSNRVRLAYGGACAMCGLTLELPQGAHIYPASAPGSRDEPWNGLALCPNHHVAFDRYLVGVHPDTRAISLHASVTSAAANDAAVDRFVSGTFDVLAEPVDLAARPHGAAFRNRYNFYGEKYEWMI
jgi:hypothetical protein